eukprot:TRINITY_DN16204_c0_g1_i1.p1 TRINITY_DN16204_c0_g1~~TRINITY_DN16204_c0_g1_i1.p1  ORF type:complete len:305 (+),score=35.07 TRINITY_DN16204_c0_g1_i1:31-945(+)
MATDEDTPWVLKRSKELMKINPALRSAEVAVETLAEVIKVSKATTMHGLQVELKEATEILLNLSPSISLASACELFNRFVTRLSDDIPNFEQCKAHAIERGEKFNEKTELCRQMIAKFGLRFIRDGARILTHGFSRCVLSILLAAAAENKRLTVFITESYPGATGYDLAKKLEQDERIRVTMISDSCVAPIMSQIDLIFVGAEAVVENGGIINKVGTYGISIIGKEMKKPLYVAAESYKFTRLYPLSQSDFPSTLTPVSFPSPHYKSEQVSLDYTPPSYITLLITELGVLTPSAVSDELIKLYL